MSTDAVDASAQTVRRDIRRLSEDGILSRYHGGASQGEKKREEGGYISRFKAGGAVTFF